MLGDGNDGCQGLWGGLEGLGVVCVELLLELWCGCEWGLVQDGYGCWWWGVDVWKWLELFDQFVEVFEEFLVFPGGY